MQVMGTAVIKKCKCGHIKHYTGCIIPDETQQRNIAEAVNRGQVEITTEDCQCCVRHRKESQK